ncbi:MAG: hypothetical protein R2883_04655 [Caldisericia bacterium]
MDNKSGCSLPLMTGFLVFTSASMIVTGVLHDSPTFFWLGIGEGVIAILGVVAIIIKKIKANQNKTDSRLSQISCRFCFIES